MKYLVTCLLLFICAIAHSQDSYIEYFSKEGKKTTKDSAYYYEKGSRIKKRRNGEILQFYILGDIPKSVSYYNKDGQQGTYKSFYESGVLKEEINYVDSRRVGVNKTYYKDGNPAIERKYLKTSKDFDSGKSINYLLINYWDSTGAQLVKNGEGYAMLNQVKGDTESYFDMLSEMEYDYLEGEVNKGKRVGTWKGIILNKYRFEESYKNGNLIGGTLYADNGENIAYDQFARYPEPKNGMGTFYKFVGANMKYPTDARRYGVQGRVFVQFICDKEGSLIDVKVIKGIYPSCDAEAERVVRKAKKWNPGLMRGVPVKVRMILPITFKLN